MLGTVLSCSFNFRRGMGHNRRKKRKSMNLKSNLMIVGLISPLNRPNTNPLISSVGSSCSVFLRRHLDHTAHDLDFTGAINSATGSLMPVHGVGYGKLASAARISSSEITRPDRAALHGSPETGCLRRTILTGGDSFSPRAALRRYAETDVFAARALARIRLADS